MVERMTFDVRKHAFLWSKGLLYILQILREQHRNCWKKISADSRQEVMRLLAILGLRSQH